MSARPRPWLSATAVGALGTAYAFRPAREPSHLAAASIALAWPATEMPRTSALVLALLLRRAVASGGLGTRTGRTVVAAGGAALIGLAELDRRARRSGRALGAVEQPGSTSAPVGGRRGRTARRRRVTGIAYGAHGRATTLDVWMPPGPASAPRPVLLHVPGGAYVAAGRRRRLRPVLAAAAGRGWIVATMTYRRAPAHAWPAQIDDVERAIGWIHDHIGAYGGDPGFVAVTGSSAGAHLAALAALDRPGRTAGRGGTAAVRAVVAISGVYDWTPPAAWPDLLDYFRRCRLVPRYDAGSARIYADASPVRHVSADAPAFLVLHGGNDVFIPVAQARAFTRSLERAGADVRYVELPGAQHAFDARWGQRSGPAAQAAARFLERVHREHLRRPDGPARRSPHAPRATRTR